ncbi:MAG: GNAT family N-acetyltransferase [Oscillospiraceae bacterium]|jgi:ribosomal protein S18 acetylase RimI-like enzyme|nr:GNAT family N-acetyltransferase [Oscillospiraceae bacterium]
MEFRPAELTDLGRIMEIVGDAQRFLRESGVDQWQDGYPARTLLAEDIEKRACHVCALAGRAAGLVSLFFQHEDCYDYVENGKWLTGNARYAAFHRIAVHSEYRRKGIASHLMSYLENLTKERGFSSLRGDTHRDNRVMRGMLEKHGFVPCGIIYLDEPRGLHNARVCYEKRL